MQNLKVKPYSCNTPNLTSKRIDRLLISTRCIFFLGSPCTKNSTVKHAWWGVILEWVTSWEVFLGAHEWGQSALERLVLVCEASLQSLWVSWGVTIGLTFVEVVKATTYNGESSKHLNQAATPLDGQTQPMVSRTPSTTRKIGKIHKFMVEKEVKF